MYAKGPPKVKEVIRPERVKANKSSLASNDLLGGQSVSLAATVQIDLHMSPVSSADQGCYDLRVWLNKRKEWGDLYSGRFQSQNSHHGRFVQDKSWFIKHETFTKMFVLWAGDHTFPS